MAGVTGPAIRPGPLATPPQPKPGRRGVRVAYLVVYSAAAALGEGLLARPALLWLRGLGLLRPALPWQVPLGQTCCLLACTLGVFTLRLAAGFALKEKIRLGEHALFLLLLAFALVVRLSAAEPQPPRDPAPALLEGLRVAAAELDKSYRDDLYPLETGPIDAVLAKLPRPGFRLRGRELPISLQSAPGATGPLLQVPEAGLPGQILAAGLGTSRVWLTATTLRQGAPAILQLDQRPVVLEARAGTHSAPGRDPLVPTYPGMRLLSDKPLQKPR